MIGIQGLHHVAYRCHDAKTTVDFYTKVVGLEYVYAVSENHVPSTRANTPYFHLFFRMGDGSCVAFFEVPNSPPMQKDPNTPEWVQHLALKVDSMEELMECKERLESFGVETIGPIDHTITQSLYFFDPNGHRLEFAVNTMTPEMFDRLTSVADVMLEKWSKTKTVPEDAAWVHEGIRSN